MATIGWALRSDHINGAGISTWAMKHGTDTKYYSLGTLANTSVNVKALAEADVRGRDYTQAYAVEIAARMLNTDKTAVMQSLYNMLLGSTLYHHVTLINSQKLQAQLGVIWKLVIQGGVGKQRYVDLLAKGMVLADHASLEDLGTLYTTFSADSGSVAEDVFYPLASITSERSPSGLAQLAVRPTADSTFEDMGYFNGGSVVFESIGPEDEYGRPWPHSVKCTVEANLLQSASYEIGYLANTRDVDCKITCADGTIFTLDNSFGVRLDIVNTGDAAGTQTLKLVGGGVMTATQFSNCIS